MTERISVLYLIGSLDIGGAEQHLFRIAPALQNAGIRPAIFTVNKKGVMAKTLENLGVPVFEPYLASEINSFPNFIKIPLLVLSSSIRYLIILWTFRPKFVHFFLPQAYIFGCILSFLYWPVIRVMSRRSLNFYMLRHPFFAKVEFFLHRKIDIALANSIAVYANLVQEGIDKKKLGIIYNGIDTSQFLNLPSRNRIRESLGISNKSLMLVMVANLIPYKGHIDLINALALVHKNLPSDWVIVFVGKDSGIESQLKLAADKLGISANILWLGSRSDAVAISSAADIGLLSSHEEGFSNSILEGMFNGLPMIVTDVGGNAEAVIDGISGLVVPPKNPKALGGAILILSESESYRRLLSFNARKRALNNYSLEVCVQQYSNLYSNYYRDQVCINIKNILK
jgi:glycosyltransferase involved in cell wall biosynthesis